MCLFSAHQLFSRYTHKKESTLSKLFIFIDESGTMPLNKEKDIFVAAGFSTFNDYPIFKEKKGKKTWLIGQLIKHSAIPFISYIEPDDEYLIKVKQRFDQIEEMAKVTLGTTGNNKKYFPTDGLKRRNMIYINTINNCIGQIILNSTIKDRIDEITIYLDQKTLKKTSLNLFNNQIKRELKIMNSSIDKIHDIPESLKDFIKSRLNWNENEVRIFWSNQPESFSAEYGLELAHYLCHLFFKEYKKKESPNSLYNMLIKAGYTNFLSKTNSLLTKELNGKTIQDWEKNTGLKFRK